MSLFFGSNICMCYAKLTKLINACTDRIEKEAEIIPALSHSLSFSQPNTTPFKDLTAELHNAGNNRAHVVLLFMSEFVF